MSARIANVTAVPPAYADVKEEDAELLILESLKHLHASANLVFTQIQNRVTSEQGRLAILNERIAGAKRKVERIAGRATRDTIVFAPSKYPVPPEIPAYPSVFEGLAPVEGVPEVPPFPLPVAGPEEEEEEGGEGNDRDLDHLLLPPPDPSRLEETERKDLLRFWGQSRAIATPEAKAASSEVPRGLGALPSGASSASTLLLFNSQENPFRLYNALDNLVGRDGHEESKEDGKKEEKSGDGTGLSAAPENLMGGDDPHVAGLDYGFKPEMKELEEIELPESLALPNLAALEIDDEPILALTDAPGGGGGGGGSGGGSGKGNTGGRDPTQGMSLDFGAAGSEAAALASLESLVPSLARGKGGGLKSIEEYLDAAEKEVSGSGGGGGSGGASAPAPAAEAAAPPPPAEAPPPAPESAGVPPPAPAPTPAVIPPPAPDGTAASSQPPTVAPAIIPPPAPDGTAAAEAQRPGGDAATGGGDDEVGAAPSVGGLLAEIRNFGGDKSKLRKADESEPPVKQNDPEEDGEDGGGGGGGGGGGMGMMAELMLKMKRRRAAISGDTPGKGGRGGGGDDDDDDSRSLARAPTVKKAPPAGPIPPPPKPGSSSLPRPSSPGSESGSSMSSDDSSDDGGRGGDGGGGARSLPVIDERMASETPIPMPTRVPKPPKPPAPSMDRRNTGIFGSVEANPAMKRAASVAKSVASDSSSGDDWDPDDE